MELQRQHRDGGLVAVQVIAMVVAVVVAVTTVMTLGLPESISCEIEGSVGAVTGGPGPDCDTSITTASTSGAGSTSDGATVDLLAGETTDRDTAHQPGSLSGRGFTARELSATTSVASPATRDRTAERVAVATHARCALAPDRSTWESKICAIADTDDPHDAADGSDLLVRCATSVTQPTNDTCNPTADDNVRGHRTAILTPVADGETRFCQPLRADRIDPRQNDSPYRVDWACASWAGNLYHCTNTLSSSTFATEPTTWVTQPTFRDLWPETCDSRTFPAGTLACTPDKTTNLAACDIRGFQGLPLRPASCVYFHARPGEQGRPTHTLGHPLHCRLTTTTTTSGTAGETPCPAIVGRGPSRTLQSAPSGLHGEPMCRLDRYLAGVNAIVVGGGPNPNSLIFASQIWTPATPPTVPGNPPSAVTAANLAATVESLLGAQSQFGATQLIPAAWPTIWVTGHLPEGGHEAADGTVFTVVHPGHVGDPGLVAAAMIATTIGPIPVPDPNGPESADASTEEIVLSATMTVLAFLLANHTAPIPRTSLRRATNGSYANPGVAGQLAATTTVLYRLGNKLPGQPRPGGGIIGTQADRDRAIMHVLIQSLHHEPTTFREWYLSLRSGAERIGIDPSLVDAAFRETGGADIVTPTCKPGDRPPSGRPDDPSGPGNSGVGGTGAGGLLTAGCA